jgi:ABC-type branched-subunit amino acid transport system substrate-binding protein
MSVRRGDDAFRYKEYSAAVDAYRSYLDQTEQGAYTVRTFYKSALAEYRLGRHRETLATLDELAQRYPDGRWVQVYALRGDAERDQGNRISALHAWEEGWTVASEGDWQKLRQRIAAVARDLNGVELARARRLLTNKEVLRLLDQEIARRSPAAVAESTAGEQAPLDELDSPELQAEEPAPARADREAALVEPVPQVEAGPDVAPARPPAHAITPEPPEAEEALPLERGWPRDRVEAAPPVHVEAAPPVHEEPIRDIPKVGCLLPLTGSERALGERSLRAVRLVFGDGGYQLVLRDTGSTPATAAAALYELSRDPSILAAVGPLRNADAEAAAPVAERDRLPLLLLSQREGANGTYVVQAGLARARLVGPLLDYVMRSVRLSHFGVLYPDDASGKEFLSAFRAEVERRGGKIVGSAPYRSGAANPAADTGTLMKWRDSQNLQAIFLPDGAVPAAALARLLQREMPDVMLLGVSGWEDLADDSGGAALDGVLFTDTFHAGSARPATRQFVAAFEQTYGALPGAVEAQAYDAAMLVKRALDAGARSRAAVMESLHAPGLLEGATGELRLTPSGLQRDVFLLQVYNGMLREIGGSEG